MAILKLVSLAALAGCYSPSVRDCTVTCNAQSDCASGQVCGGDHYCASALSAGTCAPLVIIGDAEIDAVATAPVDAAPDARPDARPPIDAAPRVGLHVHIDGKGSVVVTGVATCDEHDCTYGVVAGLRLVLVAVPHADQRFDRWTTVTCGQQDASCTFTPTVATTVGAKFTKEN